MVILDHDENNFIAVHQPCPKCDSSDAVGVNKDGSAYCFSCNSFMQDYGEPQDMTQVEYKEVPMRDHQGIVGALTDRNIKQATAKKFGVEVTYASNGDIATHIYPYFHRDTGERTGSKIRTVKTKDFKAEGKTKDAGLFGQQLFSKGKYITIYEGECDAMAGYELTGSKWASVSVKNGAAGAVKDIKHNLEYFENFDNVVICFDNDKVGKEASKRVAELFPPSKAKICTLNEYKDANEYLMNNKLTAFTTEWWASKLFAPDGIVRGDEMWGVVTEEINQSFTEYPWQGLNDLTYGIRDHELITLTAGSGMGKSQVLRELIHHLLNNGEDEPNIGLLMMEESIRRTGLSLMSLEVNQLLHLPDVSVSDEELREAYDKTLGTGRLFLYDSFGSNTIDNIISRVRYMAKGLDCKFIFLDHISIIVSDQQHGDERKALDEIATKLRTLVQETGVALFMVSHLRRPNGVAHEEGGATSLSQLRGTAGIGQLSDIVIGLERNGQHEDENVRNTTTVRVLKNRFTGLTGPATYLFYDKHTGRMTETDNPETGANDEDEF